MTPAELDEIDREAAVGSYGAIARTRKAVPALVARVRQLEAERDKWQLKWEDLEVSRASCCSDNEKRAEAAEARCKALEAELNDAKWWADQSSFWKNRAENQQSKAEELGDHVKNLGARIFLAEAELTQLRSHCKELEDESQAWMDDNHAKVAELTQLRAQVEAMRGALEKLSSAASDGLTALGHLGAVQPVRGHLWDALDEAERVLAGKASR